MGYKWLVITKKTDKILQIVRPSKPYLSPQVLAQKDFISLQLPLGTLHASRDVLKMRRTAVVLDFGWWMVSARCLYLQW
jgi:hypothetical protein